MFVDIILILFMKLLFLILSLFSYTDDVNIANYGGQVGAYIAGQRVRVVYVTTPTNYMEGVIASIVSSVITHFVII